MTQEELTITTCNKLLKILAIFVLVVAVTFYGGRYAIAQKLRSLLKNCNTVRLKLSL
ncbi:hypothetical protein [Nostoc sp.]|uniref:hypothetical protein n=1 Tax=Nostoc sp. TaxID=1180 RepID=UPI002FF8129A